MFGEYNERNSIIFQKVLHYRKLYISKSKKNCIKLIKMNNKAILTGLFLCLVVILSSCGQRSGASTGGVTGEPFIGGTQGVMMEFEKDSPPPEVTDDTSFAFQVLVKLKNEGEMKIERNQMKLKVEGFDPADFGRTFDEMRDVEPDDDLESKKKDAEGNIVEGTTTFATFPRGGGYLEPTRFTGNTEFQIRAKACYLYQTDSNTKLCGLRDMINVRDNAICRPTEGKTVYSSSGPVQVQGFRQSVVGKDKISFSFDVVLANSVDIFWSRQGQNTPAQGFDAACPEDPRTRREVENNVEVEITEVPVDPVFANLKCGGLDNSNIGVVKLVNGKRTITCTVELVPDRNDFEKVVGIKLRYNVLDSKDTRIIVKHLADAP
jgi:hypothetical protein